MGHGTGVSGELVVARGDAGGSASVAAEAFVEVARAIELLAKAGLPVSVGLGRIGRRALRIDQIADAIGVIGLVTQDDAVAPAGRPT